MRRPLCELGLPLLPRGQGPACARPITGLDHPFSAGQRRPPSARQVAPVSRQGRQDGEGGWLWQVVRLRRCLQGAPGIGGVRVVGRTELEATTVTGEAGQAEPVCA